MFALVDCNNFFVSCECVFNPCLAGKPVVVLSNNDGCVVSRSNEAKALGVKMGEPYFQLKQRFGKACIALSSQYELYLDFSNRVMSVLAEHCPFIEFYSIDEAFLQLDQVPVGELRYFALKLRRLVLQNTGIPVSIGMAQTKVLSKLANHVAKKFTYLGVKILIEQDEIDKWLMQLPIEEVWGVGRQLKTKLAKLGITSAKHLQKASVVEIQKKYGSAVTQLIYELNGHRCFVLEKNKPKKTITYSRSFGKLLSSFEPVKQALVYFVTRACEKLRQQQGQTKQILVFLQTNRHRQDLPQSQVEVVVNLPCATSDTRVVVSHAVVGLNHLWKTGFLYKKVGIILLDLTYPDSKTLSLWQDQAAESEKLMSVIDAINQRYGKESVFLASQGTAEKTWGGRKEQLSKISKVE